MTEVLSGILSHYTSELVLTRSHTFSRRCQGKKYYLKLQNRALRDTVYMFNAHLSALSDKVVLSNTMYFGAHNFSTSYILSLTPEAEVSSEYLVPCKLEFVITCSEDNFLSLPEAEVLRL